MSDSNPNHAGENRKKIETISISNMPDLEVIPLPNTISLHNVKIPSTPSTSKEPNKIDKLQDISPNTHIVPLLSKDGKKYIQISPIKSVPKDKLKNLIQLPNSPLPGLNLDTIIKFEVGSKALQALRTVKTATKSSSKVPAVTLKAVEESQENNIPSCTKQVRSSKISTDITIKPVKNILSSKGTIPAILRKRAKLNDSKNTPPSTSEENKTSLQSSQDQKTVTKIVNKSSTCQKKSDQTQRNLNKEMEMAEMEKNTFAKKEKQLLEGKIAVRKDRSSKKKKKDKEKVTNSWRNEESMYIADGFREDVENLIEKCLQGNRLHYERFCEVWKEMDFPCIFHGRQSSAELAELSEEVIHIAKAYMLSNEDNFEENVAGLFLVYALLNHQPFSGFAALRLIPRDVPIILGIEAEAKRQKRHDVLYVLGNVLIKGPCQFHVLDREVSMEPAIKKYFDGSVQSSKVMDNVCTKNSKCVSLFKKLISLEETYAAAQKQLEKYREEDKTSILSKRLAAELYKMYEAHIPSRNLVSKSKEVEAPAEPEENRANIIKSIKNRAMGNMVDSMRHLTGVEERQVELSSSEESEAEVEAQNITTIRNLHFAGRSNATALALQKFFCEKESNDNSIFVPQPSQKEMPALDRDERREPEQDDTEIINLENPKEQNNEKKNGRDLKNYKSFDLLDSSSPGLGRIKVYNIKPPDKRIGRKRNVSSNFASNVNKKQEHSNNNKKKYDNQGTNNESINNMPQIAIENEVNKDIEIESGIDSEAVVPKTEKKSNTPKRKVAAVSDKLSNNNTVPERDIKSKNSKKAKAFPPNSQPNNRNIKPVLEKSVAKRSPSGQKLPNTISKKDDDDRRPRKCIKIEKDSKPITDGKQTDRKHLPERSKRNDELSNLTLSIDKSKTKEKPKSPTKSRTKLNTNKSPKIASIAKQISSPTRVSARIKKEKNIKCEDDAETKPAKRRRMQYEG